MSERVLLSPEQGMELIGVKKSMMSKLLREGQIGSIRIGRLRRIPLDEIHRFVARQLEAQANAKGQK
jgi:excisionase family DNA binding protein